MSSLTSSSTLQNTTVTFDTMIKKFGVVTVMNATVFKAPLQTCVGGASVDITTLKAHDIVKLLKAYAATDSNGDKIAKIDSLKIANINIDGPDKTITGGQYANPLIKFGKTATIEMQDALGNIDALQALGGAVVETFTTIDAGTSPASPTGNTKVVHFTEDFSGPKVILGDSFFIDQATGTQVKVNIVLYQVLPDSIFNLTQDSEGDATVFDLNGSLLTTNILIGPEGTGAATGVVKGVFYSILPDVTYTGTAG